MEKGEFTDNISHFASYFVWEYYTQSIIKISKSCANAYWYWHIRDTENTRNLEMAGKLLRGCGGLTKITRATSIITRASVTQARQALHGVWALDILKYCLALT